MKYLGQMYGVWIVTLLTGCLVLMLTGCFPAQPQQDPGLAAAGQPETSLMVKGRVSGVRPEANQLFIKPNKEKKMLVTVNQQTSYIGFSSLSELAREQVLTIWYYRQGENNIAVKIEKLPEQGC